MFKVSFKGNFMRVQTFNEKATVVTLKGLLTISPKIWSAIPKSISNWMWDNTNVNMQWGNGNNNLECFDLEATAKAVCSNDDIFDAELGKRIAESRAKLKIYHFMMSLCRRLISYYSGLISGQEFVPYNLNDCSDNCLAMEWEKYSGMWSKERDHLAKLLADDNNVKPKEG